MSWRYVEPCCGSASIALALLGAKKPLLPYQGSKWRFRRALLEHFDRLGFVGAPAAIELYDVGPWGTVAPRVLSAADRVGVLDQLRLLGRLDPKEVYVALHQQPAPCDPIAFSAQFLFLQRLSYSGKAVGVRSGNWMSPGFNTSSAYGLPGTDRFGKVNPMIPSLIGVLEGYDALDEPAELIGASTPAPTPSGSLAQETLVYLDPPYAGATAYPGGDLDREGVVELAEAWRNAGATVVISEAVGIDALVDRGWKAEKLDAGRKDTSRFRGKQEEWLTIGRAPSQEQLAIF